jgi:hypothetical protein
MTIDTSIPLDNHPDALTGDALGPHLEVAKDALRNIYDTWATINRLEKEVKDKRALAVEVDNVLTRVGRTTDTRIAELQKAEELNDAALHSVLESKGSDPAAAEIRAHFARQKHPAAELTKAILANDSRTTRAVLAAPAYLSGLTGKEDATIRDIALQIFAPDNHAKREQLDRAIARIERAGTEFLKINMKRVHRWGTTKDKKLLKALKNND